VAIVGKQPPAPQAAAERRFEVGHRVARVRRRPQVELAGEQPGCLFELVELAPRAEHQQQPPALPLAVQLLVVEQLLVKFA